MPLIATRLVKSPARLAGPTLVRVDEPGLYYYHTPVVEDSTPVYPAIVRGPAIPEKLVSNVIDDVQVVNVCTLIHHKFGTDYNSHPDYLEISDAITSWCKYHKAHDYSRPRESFSLLEAAREARKLGLGVVVVEDLS